jgi:hypothetical protein
VEAVKTFLQNLNRYWFGYGSPLTIGVFRAILGGLTFINYAMIAPFFGEWFSEKGFVPAELGARWLQSDVYLRSDGGMKFIRLNPLYGVTNDTVVMIVYAVTLVAALTTCLGLWSRVSSILLAIGVVTLHHRNSIILHGGDTAMRVMVMYLALAPSGAAFSLDRWLARQNGRATAELAPVSLWPQRLMQFNVALIYFTTCWAKWGGDLWRNGVATWYPSRLHEFDKFPVPAFINDFPMVYVSTWGTLAVEFAMGSLVFFKPLRKWVLLAGIMMHGYIEWSMNIPLFAFVMVSTYVTFYEGEEVAGWWDRLKARFNRGRESASATDPSIEDAATA